MNARLAELQMEPQTLGLLQLRSDPQFFRIEPERRAVLVEAAIADGRFLAADVRSNLGSDPASIAASCGVPVIDSDSESGFGSIVVFAEYATRPPSITLYGPAIGRLDAKVAGEGAERLGILGTLSLIHI